MPYETVEGTWRTRLSIVGAVFLGAVLIVATVGKAADPVLFVEQIRTEGLEGLLSANSIALIALAMEAGLGIALVTCMRNLWVLVPTSAMIAFFIFLTGRNYWLVVTGQRDDSYDCGCFGVFLQRTATEAFWQDLLLLVPPLILVFLSRQALSFELPKWRALIAVCGALGIVIYTFGFGGLPPAASVPGVPANVPGDRDLLHESSQFVLFVDGREDPQASIFESDTTLRIVVLTAESEKPFVLDIRTFQVMEFDSAQVSRQTDEVVSIPFELAGSDKIPFFLKSEGLSFQAGRRLYELRNRLAE